eukprot:Sdes_comp20402_c0_seq7m14400
MLAALEDSIKKESAREYVKTHLFQTDDLGSQKKFHIFSDEPMFGDPPLSEIACLRASLLQWFDANHRKLPWRKLNCFYDSTAPKKRKLSSSSSNIKDRYQRGYEVWVSEIMLQQTRVATVIQYYEKWMKQFPTVESLAQAGLDQVLAVWQGLGYYSRARRIHEGAQKIVQQLHSVFPTSSKDLSAKIPGIGRYTAGAISSIAFDEVTGVVDGNVIRVLSRLRSIGSLSDSSHTVDLFWEIANSIVDPDRPGDFNQAIMELGATICTPQSPSCGDCPLKFCCRAYHQSQLFIPFHFSGKNEKCQDSLPSPSQTCKFCLPPGTQSDEGNLQVTIYPVKKAKKKSKDQNIIVFILEWNSQYFMTRRDSGLLSGLWEFPTYVFAESEVPSQDVDAKSDHILTQCGLLGLEKLRQRLGSVQHIFSHINATYFVEHFLVPETTALCVQNNPALLQINWPLGP